MSLVPQVPDGIVSGVWPCQRSGCCCDVSLRCLHCLLWILSTGRWKQTGVQHSFGCVKERSISRVYLRGACAGYRNNDFTAQPDCASYGGNVVKADTATCLNVFAHGKSLGRLERLMAGASYLHLGNSGA